MRREFNGAVPRAELTFALGGTTADLTIICDDLTGWPTGLHPFFVVVNRGKASEEKILISSRTSNILTVWSDGLGAFGRAKDDTAIAAHPIGSKIEHIFTATDADEANEHVNEGTGAHGYPPIADIVLDADLAAHAADTSTHGITSEIVGRTETQTLTNKTISGAANTLSNIPESAVTGLVADLASKAVYPTQTGHAGELLGTNGTSTAWVEPTSLVPLVVYSDEPPVDPADGTIWVDKNDIIAGGAGAYADLTDVDMTGIADGDVPVWDAGTSTWLPGAGGGGGGGATGAGGDQVFYENDTHVTTSYTITTGKNAMSAGPITVDVGAVVTVPGGSVWTVV